MGNKFLKTAAAAAFILGGTGLMVYPFVANYVFEHRQDSIISTYEASVSGADAAEIEEMLSAAVGYNESLLLGNVQLHDPFTEEIGGYGEKDYYKLLNPDGNGIMGYITIPCIDVNLPVYHGTSEKVLETGIGHLEGSSVPVGGDGTHCVLTGHTGLSGAKLFTDLTLLEEGDIFVLTVLGEKLAYEVDQIKIVEPNDTSDLSIMSGEDYCTLLTCTPYGINTHRLLIRGHRTEYTEELEAAITAAATKTENSEWMRQYRRSIYAALSLIAAAFLIMFLISRGQKRRNC